MVKYSLITPDRVFISGEADMVVCPGAEGYFGVLEKMSPLISDLNFGAVVIFEKRQVAKRIFISGGVAEVKPDELTILAYDAEDFDSIDAVTLKVSLLNTGDSHHSILAEKTRLVQDPPYSKF